MYSKEFILDEVAGIRADIGHDNVDIFIEDVYFENNELWIITEDRPDKSAIIGKGGWVVGKLREKLGLDSIHVESYGDFLNKKYKLELSKKTLVNLDLDLVGVGNLSKVIDYKLNNIYSFSFDSFFDEFDFAESDEVEAVVALSGGVDSSFSLILAKKLGFNPVCVTVGILVCDCSSPQKTGRCPSFDGGIGSIGDLYGRTCRNGSGIFGLRLFAIGLWYVCLYQPLLCQTLRKGRCKAAQGCGYRDVCRFGCVWYFIGREHDCHAYGCQQPYL